LTSVVYVNFRIATMTMMRIRLELARDHDHPEGSRKHGYEFAAPLTEDGHLNAAAWKQQRDRCRVRRFWEGHADEIGRLVHRPGGSWAFDYNPKSKDDDEPGYRFSTHRFVPGEYVSLTEHDGVQRTFRVTAVGELD
jgi:hypothetical protein